MQRTWREPYGESVVSKTVHLVVTHVVIIALIHPFSFASAPNGHDSGDPCIFLFQDQMQKPELLREMKSKVREVWNQARIQRAIRQSDAAKALSIQQSAFNRLLNRDDSHPWTAPYLISLARFLGVAVDDLLPEGIVIVSHLIDAPTSTESPEISHSDRRVAVEVKRKVRSVWIRMQGKNRQIRQSAAAAILGISQPQLSKLLNDDQGSPWTAGHLTALARYLQVPLPELLPEGVVLDGQLGTIFVTEITVRDEAYYQRCLTAVRRVYSELERANDPGVEKVALKLYQIANRSRRRPPVLNRELVIKAAMEVVEDKWKAEEDQAASNVPAQ